uniref:Conserved oligomeric Golgi complex subunit 4 n=1 Tax=Macrostomum lignano TaxID=282301 RepID=A0A1I8G969_9PLAT
MTPVDVNISKLPTPSAIFKLTMPSVGATSITNAAAAAANQDPDLQRLLAKVERIGATTRRLDSVSNSSVAIGNGSNSASAGLEPVLADACSLSEMIRCTSELADRVSSKVRQLDCAKSRVTAGLQRVEDIIDLKACTDGVQKALQDEDYEIAAAHIHRYLTLDETVMRMTADASEGSTLEASFEVLHKSEAVLKDIVHKQFDLAVQRQDRASIERFFKIFPLLNLHQAGLEKLGGYLGGCLREQCEKARIAASSAAGQDGGAWAAQQLLQLYEAVAASVEVHQPLVETFYGPGHLFGLLQVLQNEVDAQAKRIVDRFRSLRDLDSRVRLARTSATRHQQSQQQYGPGSQAQMMYQQQQQQSQQLDAKQLDAVLSELAVLSSRTELYLRFVSRRCLTDWAAADSKGGGGGGGAASGAADSESESVEQRRQRKLDDFLGKCAVTRCIQKLVDEYCLLEEHFMREMLAKAVALDSGVGGSDPTDTRLADDAFFILKKCLRRAVSTGSADATCAALNRAADVAEAQLIGALRSRLGRGFPSGWVQDAFGSKASVEEARQAYLAALNCAEACRGNLRDLRRLLESDTTTGAGRRDREKLLSCLQAMDAGLGEALAAIVNEGVECLTEISLRPQVKQILAPLSNVSHVITEEELLAYEASDPWVEAACLRIGQLADGFQRLLLPPLFDTLLQSLAGELVLRAEKLIARKQFNRLGGLQLDREVRSLAACLSARAAWSVRDKLARLSQTAMLLGLESLDELTACWSDSVMAWRLTPAEVRHMLALRVDFRQDDVRRLRFCWASPC